MLIIDCNKCQLSKNCKLHPMESTSQTKSNLIVFSQSPTNEEFETNLSWYDLSHKFIQDKISRYIKFPVKYSYALKCPGSKKPEKDLNFCMQNWLEYEIKESNTQVVLFLGRSIWKGFGADLVSQNPKASSSIYLNQLFITNECNYAFAETPTKIYNSGEKIQSGFEKLLEKINSIIKANNEIK